jgi:hypothetical protein
MCLYVGQTQQQLRQTQQQHMVSMTILANLFCLHAYAVMYGLLVATHLCQSAAAAAEQQLAGRTVARAAAANAARQTTTRQSKINIAHHTQIIHLVAE